MSITIHSRALEYINKHLSDSGHHHTKHHSHSKHDHHHNYHKHESKKLATITYQKAKNVVDKLFCDFESANLEDVSNIVNDLSVMIVNNNATFKSMSEIMSYDYYTHTHSVNVGIYAMCFGKYVNLLRHDIEKLGLAGLLHDLGKISIERDIINKDSGLTPVELDEINSHPNIGSRLAIDFGVIDTDVLDAIRLHHEKIDGSGYPNALKNDDIPYFAKIICVCDIFDALTTKRSYKDSLKSMQALLIMKNDEMFKGKLDKTVLDNFIRMLGS